MVKQIKLYLNAELLNYGIPAKKVHVGDIDIGYKILGKGDPILLFNGASDNMNAWDPSFLTGISSNHTVIVFDQTWNWKYNNWFQTIHLSATSK